MQVKNYQDGTLAFRKSCAHGVCGSDAMRITGKDGLACKTLIKDVVAQEGDGVTLEPLRHLPVQRDLIVDQQKFFEKYRAVKPFLINTETVTAGERLQTQEERGRLKNVTSAVGAPTETLEKTLNFMGTNDHHGDYRSSGCSASWMASICGSPYAKRMPQPAWPGPPRLKAM